MTSIKIWVAGPPMQKERIRINYQTGTKFTPPRTVNWESVVARETQQAMGQLEPFRGALRADVTLYMPIAASWSKRKQAEAESGIVRPLGRPDADNIAKLLDGMQMVAFVNDSQIVELHVFKFYSRKPGLEIAISTL